MTTTDNVDLRIIVDKLKANKRLFFWFLPIVFAAVLVLGFCRPKLYKSEMLLAVEDQLSIEQNRVYTHNMPENYDLGVMRTDIAIQIENIEGVFGSQMFAINLLADTVETMDATFRGTLREYLTGCASSAPCTTDHLSKEDVLLLESVQQLISADADEMAKTLTLSAETRDNLVSKQVVEHAYRHLLDYIWNYQLGKMEITLAQLQTLTEQAKEQYETALREHSSDTQRLEDIFRSFERQTVVYKAQMMYHPAVSVVSEATISYKNANANPIAMALLGTILVGLLLAAWICRKELIDWF